MAKKKRNGLDLDLDVVDAARQRILKCFSLHKYVCVSFSGGKDSITVLHLVMETMKQNGISGDRLIVIFVDEEAIYPDVEKSVLQWRSKVLQTGGKFYWFALQFKHFNCCNTLAQDESFICFEQGKEDVWVRQPPPFAIRRHKEFRLGMTYQRFLTRILKGIPNITGVRIYESVQRIQNLAKRRTSGEMDEDMVQVIYDWKDSDVWLYLYKNNVDLPMTYVYLYKTGVGRRGLRLSQFFSIDTIKTLPNVAEFYPKLYDAVLRREPNAELVSLYFQTRMFRSSKQDKEHGVEADYKEEFRKEIVRAAQFPSDYAGEKVVRTTVMPKMLDGVEYPQSVYRGMLEILFGGDPKNRSARALLLTIYKINDQDVLDN